jgi:hypothetical protein
LYGEKTFRVQMAEPLVLGWLLRPMQESQDSHPPVEGLFSTITLTADFETNL